MTPLALCAVLLASGGTSPDPKSLTIPERDLTRAKALAARLGDEAFPVRDRATRDLFKMGRLALPVVESTLADATDPEVRARCEWLLPKALAADNKAKLDTFLADADGRYDHDLPGWTELAKAAGPTKPARELFVEMVKAKENADLLAALRTPDQLAAKLVARRAEVYARIYGMTPDRARVPPAPAEVAALVLAEVHGSAKANDKRMYYATFLTLNQPAVRDAVGKREALRKLVAHWLDTRTDPAEQTQAMNAAANLNLKEVTASALALRVLAPGPSTAAKKGEEKPAAAPVGGFSMTAYAKTQALGILAKSGEAAHLPTLRKFFADDGKLSVFRVNNGVQQQVEMTVGDFALAMAIDLTRQDPRAYGFDVQNTGGQQRYWYYNYTFASEEKREFAFAKWAFRETFKVKK